jgi:hypothetical protein
MGSLRFLTGAALLLGACETLWAPFQGANSSFCDPDSPVCNNAGDGGLGTEDAAVGDAAVGDAAVGDAAAGDASQNSDLLCNPGTASLWAADAVPPGASATALTGITGSGAGDLWTVGNPTYVAHRGASWNMISLGAAVPTMSHVSYSPNLGQALALGTGLLNGQVLHLSQSSVVATDLLSVLPVTMTGLWVSAAPESLPYAVGADGTFKSYSGGLWSDVGTAAPSQLAAITGVGMAGATTIWGVSATANMLAAYPGAAPWRTATTGPNSFSAAWVSLSNNSVVLVGKSGVIMTAPAAVPPIGALSPMSSPVTTALSAVAGTADGKHLWAVGVGGTILHWESVCRTWTQEASPKTQDLNALWVSDSEQMVWAVGANGTVVRRAIP